MILPEHRAVSCYLHTLSIVPILTKVWKYLLPQFFVLKLVEHIPLFLKVNISYKAKNLIIPTWKLWFWEMRFINGHPRSATVTALDENQVSVIPKIVSTPSKEPILRLWNLYYESFQHESQVLQVVKYEEPYLLKICTIQSTQLSINLFIYNRLYFI